jgi:hypothetical protein
MGTEVILTSARDSSDRYSLKETKPLLLDGSSPAFNAKNTACASGCATEETRGNTERPLDAD